MIEILTFPCRKISFGSLCQTFQGLSGDITGTGTGTGDGNGNGTDTGTESGTSKGTGKHRECERNVVI